MPTAVVDLDLLNLPSELRDLGAYEGVLVLIRLAGRPIGQVRLPLRDGRVDRFTLREALFRASGQMPWQAWVDLYLAPLAPPPASLPSATIVICTRNRAADLVHCLTSLQTLPDDGQQILVVDNAPSDTSTRDVVAQFPAVRYVREDRAGLAAARNRALREARSEIVAFTDDDAVVEPDWLRCLLRNFADPLVLGVAGLTMPLELETPAQEWFERFVPFGRGFERRVFDFTNHDPLQPNPVGSGVSLAFRRSVLQAIGPFDEAFGPGTPSKSGADSELLSRILQAGYRLVYDPAALNWHRHRREWPGLLNRMHDYGTGRGSRWTRELLVNHEFGVVLLASRWLVRRLLRYLVEALRAPGTPLPALIGVDLRGLLRGPAAYLAARKAQRIRASRP